MTKGNKAALGIAAIVLFLAGIAMAAPDCTVGVDYGCVDEYNSSGPVLIIGLVLLVVVGIVLQALPTKKK